MSRERTMNDENLSTPCGDAWYVEKIDMVLSEGHDRLVVVCCEASLLHIDPRKGGRICGLFESHIEGVEFSF